MCYPAGMILQLLSRGVFGGEKVEALLTVGEVGAENHQAFGGHIGGRVSDDAEGVRARLLQSV